MPGKANQNWTDDAAFWDEAWADMEQRLEGKKRPKGLLFWTRGVVLGVLLLVGMVTAWALAGNESGETSFPEPTKPNVVPAEVAPPPAVVAQQYPSAPEDDTEASQRISAVDRPGLPQASPTAAPAKQGKASAGAEDTPAVGSQPSLRKTNGIPSALGNGPTSRAQQPDNPAAASPPTAENFRSNSLQNQRRSTPLSPVNGPAVHLTYGEDLPKTKVRLKKQGLPLMVTATGSLARGRTTPGFSIGVGTVISQRGKINFPLSLRYRRDFMRLAQKNAGGATDEAVGFPTADMANNAFEPLRLTVGTSGTALSTSGIEISAGMQYRISPRLSFGANLRTAYLLTANGVINATQDGETFAYTFNNRNTSDLGLSGAFNNVSVSSDSTSGLSGNSAINRHRLRAGIQLKYRIFSDFSVMAGVTRIVTPTYGNDLLRVRPTQLQLGMEYRLR